MMIGAPMIAPAIPQTCENNITVNNKTNGEIPIFEPERFGSTNDPNTCWFPRGEQSSTEPFQVRARLRR